ncbi:HDOD domain-containing protein [Sulfurospirillum deleyianum]|uniref:Metal-dependent hydrolase HDOD n=1 Tax=Sulfurospirillum deleyianum (strain ATCC 51133 / DSM 6946 / 5175) TaxID=525898 RepID=D1AZX6_SULD5|nr:HDOD domain-containing protein [Sulfurospirillum deleyianum]ACZ11593.1 Metal-dependent hydrolase HDOD [Sulfurospirillum deleyianum DSM 6946]
MLEAIAERIKALPPLPKSFHEMTKVCQDPQSGINDLAHVIEKDPMLVANLLKIANSPLYGFRREIKTIIQAVGLFGMSTTRSLVTDMSIKKLLQVDMAPYGITPEEFAMISGMQSALMLRWYGKVDTSKIDMLFLAALLQETGKILIADEVMKNDETYSFRSEIETCVNIADVEKMFVGMSSSEVTALIFKHWKFDTKMVEAILYSDSWTEAHEEIQSYALALKIVKTAIPLNAPLSERSINVALNLIEKAQMDTSPFLDAIAQLKSSF